MKHFSNNVQPLFELNPDRTAEYFQLWKSMSRRESPAVEWMCEQKTELKTATDGSEWEGYDKL